MGIAKKVLRFPLAVSLALTTPVIFAQPQAPVQETTPAAAQDPTVPTANPLTKDQMKSQKKLQKSEEKAASDNAKSAKATAKAKKSGDKAERSQEKAQSSAAHSQTPQDK